jgi:MFS family permease
VHTLHDENYISLIGAIAGIFGGIRFQWGPLVKALGFKAVYSGILLLEMIIGYTFPQFGALYKSTFAVYLGLIFFAEGAHFTLMPIMISRMFGEHATMVYGFGFSFSGFSSLISSLLIAFVFNDDFETCYYLGASLCVVSLVILGCLFREEKFN